MKVLVAEDSKLEFDRTKGLLESWGFEVAPADNGAAAIRVFHEDPAIHLAVLDWEMPVLSGLKVLTQIRSTNRFVYAIMVTGNDDEAYLEKAFAMGANDFVKKPYRPVELNARLTAGKRIVEAQIQLVQAQKLESIGQLAAGIAHEINTPSQYVCDNLEFLDQSFGELGELLKKYRALHAAAETGDVTPEIVSQVKEAIEAADVDFLEAEIPRALQQSREGIARVSEIVRAMKDFSHPGSPDRQPIDLNRAIESTVTVARNEWKDVAELEMELDANLPHVPCLPGELNQVVLNIVVNAAQALSDPHPEGTAEMGKIRIRTIREGEDWAVIEISDNGPGMPEDVRNKVFDPFFTTKDVGKGTGQGLAIAYSVITVKHGGRIEVESEVGQGTTFRIHLPLHEPKEREAAA